MIQIDEEKLKEIIEQAHMAGQHSAAGCDPSYSEAFAYYSKHAIKQIKHDAIYPKFVKKDLDRKK